jgi:phosphoglycolate phosphatase
MERAFGEVFGLDGFERADGVAYAGRTDPVILEGLARAFEIRPEVFRKERDRLERTFVRALAGEMARPDTRRRLLPGVLPLLERLERLDAVHLGLLTGNMEAGARAKLEPFGLNRFFAAGGFASDHPDRREIARIAHRKLSDLTGIRFRPDDVTVVGDTEHDVDCARANHYRSVAVHSGWVDREALERARPDALLDALSDPGVLEALGIPR